MSELFYGPLEDNGNVNDLLFCSQSKANVRVNSKKAVNTEVYTALWVIQNGDFWGSRYPKRFQSWLINKAIFTHCGPRKVRYNLRHSAFDVNPCDFLPLMIEFSFDRREKGGLLEFRTKSDKNIYFL